MKRTVCIVISFALCLLCGAQDKQVSEILEKMQSSMVTLNYHVVTGGKIPVQYDGTAVLQQDKFLINGNGVTVYCDGKAVYAVDPKAKEVYIESTTGIADFVEKEAGNLKEFSVSDVKYSGMSGDIEQFTFDTSSLDRSWIVTDLR